MSFGGPEKPEEVVPFLRNVTEGRGIPDERLEEVGEHYYGFGGKSPINDQNRALLAALQAEVESRGLDVPVLWGNRNWEPYLTDVVRDQVVEHGRTQFLAIDTSAYSSYSSCRQYREDFWKTRIALADEGHTVGFDKIRQYFNHPGFARAELECLREGLAGLADVVTDGRLDPEVHRVLFTTHSIPQGMQDASEAETVGYAAQHRELIEWMVAELGDDMPLDWELVYCSRSGAPHVPWLDPDVNDRMEELKEAGVTGIVTVPLGFVSDHMEVAFDLDTEARQTAADLGLDYFRAPTVGTRPEFVSGLVDLVLERAAQRRGEEPPTPAVTPQGALTAGSGACSIECCRGAVDRGTTPVWAAAGTGDRQPIDAV